MSVSRAERVYLYVVCISPHGGQKHHGSCSGPGRSDYLGVLGLISVEI